MKHNNCNHVTIKINTMILTVFEVILTVMLIKDMVSLIEYIKK